MRYIVRLGYTQRSSNVSQYTPIYPSIQQYSAVFSSIQQYSAVFSSIRSAGFWRSGAAVLPQTGAQRHDGARGRLRAPDRWLIVRRLDGGRPYAQTDRERLRPECKMGSRRRLRWRMSSRIDALNSASGRHASTANVGIAEPTHLGWPPRSSRSGATASELLQSCRGGVPLRRVPAPRQHTMLVRHARPTRWGAHVPCLP